METLERRKRVCVCVCVFKKRHAAPRFNLEEERSSAIFHGAEKLQQSETKLPHKRFPIPSASLVELAPVPAAWVLQALRLIRRS